ncbi:hypothetical protein C2S52_018702 [Perilla frutescens var. hirtella]|nr:hypothetical protein C2S52_018702 [Perilla frutescens var. hirtella]KAH6812381.1 hypothetical protein C2S51_026143 [Perilla frutescens var. frutescens]
MGRVRAKGKKLASANQDDPGSGDEVKVLAQKRRGRPQKPLKDEIDEDEAQKIEEDSEDSAGLANSTIKGVQQTGKKQKMNAQVKERADSVKEENGNGMKSNTEETKESDVFHSNRNRRKSKPRRAAEATVECN